MDRVGLWISWTQRTQFYLLGNYFVLFRLSIVDRANWTGLAWNHLGANATSWVEKVLLYMLYIWPVNKARHNYHIPGNDQCTCRRRDDSRRAVCQGRTFWFQDPECDETYSQPHSCHASPASCATTGRELLTAPEDVRFLSFVYKAGSSY